MESDILILGGSLAGMACAIELQKLGHNALVLEKSHFPRKKLCGEFLGPDALRALNELGLLDDVHNLAVGPVRHTHFYNRKGQAVKIHHAWMDRQFPYGLALPRECLDTLLMRFGKTLGVSILEGYRVISPVLMVDGKSDSLRRFEVHAQVSKTSDAQENRRYSCRYLVDATGRNGKLLIGVQQSSVRISDKANASKSRVGLQCHIRLTEKFHNSDLRMFLFPGGYGGVQPIGDHQANVCMLVESPMAKYLHLPFSDFILQTIGQNPAALEVLKTVELDGGFCTTGDINLAGESQNRVEQSERGGFLRIGDACLTVDPFTGSGMAHALETGRMAAHSIHSALQHGWSDERMQTHYREAYRHRFGNRLKWMSYFRPFLENSHAQNWIWPILPALLPGLTHFLR